MKKTYSIRTYDFLKAHTGRMCGHRGCRDSRGFRVHAEYRVTTLVAPDDAEIPALAVLRGKQTHRYLCAKHAAAWCEKRGVAMPTDDVTLTRKDAEEALRAVEARVARMDRASNREAAKGHHDDAQLYRNECWEAEALRDRIKKALGD